MIDIDGGNPTLTPAQLAVVRRPWDGRTLVTAGPGCGKTTTLVHRLEHLTEVDELDAAEILVLGFSRETIKHMRLRLDARSSQVRRVKAHTFDSWAASILWEQNPTRSDLAATSYDDRIQLATACIAEGVLERLERGLPAHVIIDEAQDLVGVRREMVETLLDQSQGAAGFTVVGNAAQFIYGFQVDRRHRMDETDRFFDWVRTTFSDDLAAIELDRSFRFRTAQASTALPLAGRLESLPRDDGEAARAARAIYDDLRARLASAPGFKQVDDVWTLRSLREYDGTTAILTRTNGQALAISEVLQKYDIDHLLRGPSRNRAVPPWIAELLTATDAPVVGEDRFVEILAGMGGSVPDDVSHVWRALRRVAPAARNRLDLERLFEAVRTDRIPDELLSAQPHRLVVSTIHRAKGLEFDRVLIVEPEPPAAVYGHAEFDPSDEARLLFVAMTRARDDVHSLARPDTRAFRTRSTGNGGRRWYLGGRERWMRLGMEVLEGDVDRESPVVFHGAGGDFGSVQEHLRSCVKAGDRVELRRLHDLPTAADQTPPYGVFHQGRLIGVASTRFRRALWDLLHLNPSYRVEQWPSRVVGLRVEGIEAVAKATKSIDGHAPGTRAAWNTVRLQGMGRFDWAHPRRLPEGPLL